MNMPNFLVIGAAKAGSSSLYNYLKQHPQIYVNPGKGTGFFSWEGEETDFKGPGDDQQLLINNLEDYRSLFEGVSQDTIGEVCTDYIYGSKDPERIYHHIPNAKLIAILRDPSDRGYSQFLGNYRDGIEPLTDFADALREEDARIANNWHYRWHYKQRGFYYAQLKRYFDRFDDRQIKVYLYEDYADHPVNLIQDIFRFLEVDDTFIPDISQRSNTAKVPKNKQLHQSLKKFRKLMPRGKRVVDYLINRNLYVSKPQLSPDIRQQLIQAYREDILKLQGLIQCDLSKWLE